QHAVRAGGRQAVCRRGAGAGGPARDPRVAGLAIVDDAVSARRRAVQVHAGVHASVIFTVPGAAGATAIAGDRLPDLVVGADDRAVVSAARVARARDVVVARRRAGAGIARRDRLVAGLARIDAAIAATGAGRGHAAVVVAGASVHDAH